MSGSHYIYTISRHRLTGPVEVIGHAHVLEEATSNAKVQLTISLTSVYEEINREDGFRISGEITRRHEGEGGICRDRFLNPMKSVLSSHCKVILSSTKLVTECSKLWSRDWSVVLKLQNKRRPTSSNNVSLKLWLSPKKASAEY